MIVTNCPALEDIYDMTGDYYSNGEPILSIDTPNYCIKHKKQCNLVANCIVKNVINGNGKFEVNNEK